MGKREKNTFDSTTKLNGKTFEQQQLRQVHLKSADERVDNSESLLRSIQTSAYPVANARHTNLREVISYELHVSSSPFSLVHNDGSLREPIKSDLASVLEMGIIAVQQVFQPQQTTLLFIS